MSHDPELEDFKRQIDLREYAAILGYALDRKASWSGSAVMRNSADDKIVIKLETDGHYVYFSVRDDADNGTIIDFVQRRKKLSIGAMRPELRRWLGRPATSLPSWPPLLPTSKDRLQVEKAFQKTRVALRHPYLEDIRRLSPALLGSARFAGRIRIDDHHNAVFPHFDSAGLCGFELKNRNFTGFATGGEKGLWRGYNTAEDHRLVVAEAAIDALSYASLFPDARTRYASVGGKLNPRQPGLIKAEILRLPSGSEVVAAMDNDPDGESLAAMIEQAVAESGRSDLHYRRHLPALPGADWNDVLRQEAPRPPSFPKVQP
jgi:hypothetical protein